MMNDLPFVLQRGQLSAVVGAGLGRDVPTSEDPLPATVSIDATGYASERMTRKTAVAPETTDDN